MANAKPRIVNREEWKAAIAEQRQREEELAAQVHATNAARKRLPMTPVEDNYSFTGVEGEVSLAELFQGKHQLVIYHFMYAPDWETGCRYCTRYMREIGNDFAEYIEERDTRFILVSRAPFEKLSAWAAEWGIDAPWYSGSTAFYELTDMLDPESEVAGFTVFFRSDDDTVYQTWSPDDSGELPVTGDLILQLTPYGRQVKEDEAPEGWPQPRSMYEPV